MDEPIRVRNLEKLFGRVVALEDVSLVVPSDSTLFLLGPNGSGKTTFLRLLTGVLRPTRGALRIFGEDPYRNPHRLAGNVGVAYEDHHLPRWATAREYLRFAIQARKLDDIALERAARDFGLTDYWEREMGTYSAGMRKRVMLAQAWLGNPRLLLLDEPFSNLDPQGRWLLAELLGVRSSEGRTTLVSTHLAETYAPPTHLAFLMNGQLEPAGPIGELADRFGARSATFAVPNPPEGVRLLLQKGVATVTAAGDRLTVRGDASLVQTAIEAMQGADIPAEALEESYDIWAIYRAVLSAGDQDNPIPVEAD